ncbi:MAG: DNA-directed RNA polymerase subunit omega [Aquificae bacterium]|jgi:DNA-directed RNA polymerase subunit omega|nr:DNA-directed RNA polymerase subunit omega [Aquificota bacterium]
MSQNNELYKKIEESGRPPIEKALEKVSTKYELVHAAAKRVKQLLNEYDEFIIREGDKGEIKKLTFKAIEDIAYGRVRVLSLKKLFGE